MEKWATPVRRKKKKQQRCDKRRPISLFDLQNVKNTIPGTSVNGIAEKDVEHAEKHCAKDNNVADDQVDLGKEAYFVCLSVMPDDPRGLSLQMARDTYIGRNSINGYIPDPYNTLRYGQLGCGGFIVFGNSCYDVSAGGKESKIPQLRIADKKTTAYTRAEPPELAFKHVEHLVKRFLVYGEHPVACPGETVEIRAHESKPDLNGKQGTVMEVLPPLHTTNPLESTHSNKTNTVESTPPKPKTTASSGTPSTVETCCTTPSSLSPTSRSTSTSSEEKNETVTSTSSRASNRYRVWVPRVRKLVEVDEHNLYNTSRPLVPAPAATSGEDNEGFEHVSACTRPKRKADASSEQAETDQGDQGEQAGGGEQEGDGRGVSGARQKRCPKTGAATCCCAKNEDDADYAVYSEKALCAHRDVVSAEETEEILARVNALIDGANHLSATATTANGFATPSPLPSVQNADMDSEHQECLGLMKELVQQRSILALQNVYAELEEHFEHEEKLFEKNGYGSRKSAFSATKAHIEEHERILAEIRSVVKVLEAEEAERDDETKVEKAPARETAVGVRFCERVVTDFFTHVEVYDSKYVGRI